MSQYLIAIYFNVFQLAMVVRNYMIAWCEDLKTLKLFIQSHTLPETEYILKKLGGDWYYIGWK